MKKKVLFVGSFKDKAKDGSVGGQMYAGKSLIQSDLSESIEWILLDTTGRSVPPPGFYVRLFYAVKRMFELVWLLIVKRPESVLIFCANGTSFYEKGVMAIVSSFFRIKVILAPRGGPLNVEIENSKRLRNFAAYVFNRVDFVVCQGVYWKTFFCSLVDESQHEKFVVIPNWIDLSQYKDKEIYSVEDGVVNILYMGWIQEDKGIYDIFSAIEQMKYVGENVHFHFLGDGPARLELMQLSSLRQYPFEFHFPGWVHGKKKMEYLANADIFVLASHSEGLPNSLMEAMACGVASIASNVGSIPDLIIDGETGILIEKKAVNDLAKGLIRLIKDRELRRKFSLSGRAKIVANHSICNAVLSWRKIL